MKILPRTFSGSEDVKTWEEHTRRVVTANGWSDEVAAAQVSLVLKEESELRYVSYSEDVKKSFEALMAQIVEDFQMLQQDAKKYLGSFKMEGKLLPYVEQSKKLIDAAFKDIPDGNKEQLWRDYFVEGLCPSMKMYTKLHLAEQKKVADIVKILEPLEKEKILQNTADKEVEERVNTLESKTSSIDTEAELSALKEEVKQL